MNNKILFLSKVEREKLALERKDRDSAQIYRQVDQPRLVSIVKPTDKKIESLRNPEAYIDIPPDILEREKEAIKAIYLGSSNKISVPKRRYGDKKFLFEWNEEDDTSGASLQNMTVMNGSNVQRESISKKSKESIVYEKDTHWTAKPFREMTERDWRIFKEDFNISSKGGSIPNPIRYWDEAALSDRIRKILENMYKDPTPIQRQAIPIALQRRDLIGIAETGSGKTIAFLIPILQFLRHHRDDDEHQNSHGPFALVLAPTRELALQIESEALKFCVPLRYRCISIVGGHSMTQQSFNVTQGIVDLVIATPGRLRDCIEQRILSLSHCLNVVLDEADRMIDLGFEDDLKFILNTLPSKDRFSTKSHMTMFSATMPPAVENIAKVYLQFPAVVTIGRAGQAVESVEQRVEILPASDRKRVRLLEILRVGFEPPVIVFCNSRDTVDSVVKFLLNAGYRVTSLHGSKSQEQREAAIAQLKDGSREILVATDVASRGLDIKNVSLVINYDMTTNIESYIHRIGRTGRAGESGISHTFLTKEDSDLFYDLKQILLKSKKSFCPPELANHESARSKKTVK